jgi:hypothetical protein
MKKLGERRKGLQTIRITRTRLRIRFHLITIVLSIGVFEGKRRIKENENVRKLHPDGKFGLEDFNQLCRNLWAKLPTGLIKIWKNYNRFILTKEVESNTFFTLISCGAHREKVEDLYTFGTVSSWRNEARNVFWALAENEQGETL